MLQAHPDEREAAKELAILTSRLHLQRFMKLYQFSKLLWSLEGSDVADAPEWLEDLKIKLACARDRLRQGFAAQPN